MILIPDQKSEWWPHLHNALIPEKKNVGFGIDQNQSILLLVKDTVCCKGHEVFPDPLMSLEQPHRNFP